MFCQLLEPKRFPEVMAFKPLENRRTREGEGIASGHTAADDRSPDALIAPE